MDWLNSFESICDLFIFVSNGNDNALIFYQSKGFKIGQQIFDGFITVLREYIDLDHSLFNRNSSKKVNLVICNQTEANRGKPWFSSLFLNPSFLL